MTQIGRDMPVAFLVFRDGVNMNYNRTRKKTKIDRCCCTCDRNIRVKDENGMVTHCECLIDGHYISYIDTFEHSCHRYALDKAYKPGGKWYKPENFE